MTRAFIISAGVAVAIAGVMGVSAQQPAPAATTAAASAGSARAARPGPDPNGPAPRMANGKPDLIGVWQGGSPSSDIEDGVAEGEEIPMLPAAKKLFESRQAKDDPQNRCLPSGVPRTAQYPWRIVGVPSLENATHIFFLLEGNIHSYRQIFMDGRQHPTGDALNPTWFGDSIGHWEGDTLVVDSVGFNDLFWFDFVGHPHSERLHVVERYTRKTFGTLENEILIDDPGAYSRPWYAKFTARIQPNTELMEYICAENEKSNHHLSGPALRDLPRRNPRPAPWREVPRPYAGS